MHAITAEGYVCVSLCVCVSLPSDVCVHGKEGRRKEMNAKWGQKENSAEQWGGSKDERRRKQEVRTWTERWQLLVLLLARISLSFLQFKLSVAGDL